MELPVWIDRSVGDLRYAVRMIRKTPGATAIAVVSLALGIGANTAIFSLIDTVLLKNLPIKSPREVFLVAADPAKPNVSWNYPDYVAFRDRNQSFSGLAAVSFGAGPVGLQFEGSGSTGITELAYTSMVSGNYFEVLGVKSAIGRLLNPEDDRKPGAGPYVVLSHAYWQRRFSGDNGVIGRTLRLNGFPMTVVGVAGAGFKGTDVASSPDMFVPIMMRSELTGIPFTRWNTRNNWWMQAIGRLKPGASVKQAESELFVIFKDQEDNERRAGNGKNVNRARPIVLKPAARGFSSTRNRLEKPLLVLMVVVALVLLIACANVANLMLARGAARQREMAVRLAVGATRGRLTSQLLAESVLIGILGGLAGLLLSYFGVQALLRFVPQNAWNPSTISVTPDIRLLGFTAALSLLTGILFGIAPALQSTRPDLVPALKEDVPGSTGAGSRWTLRNILVVAQVALSLLLLIGSGLFVRSLGNLRDVETGFSRANLITAFLDPGRNGYKGQRLRDFLERVRSDAQALPGVQSVSLAEITPLGGSRWNTNLSVDGFEWKEGDKKYIDMNAVSPRYFETAGIQIMLGRDFGDQDNPPYSVDPPATRKPGEDLPELPGQRVAIVTESMARRFYAGRNPIGMTFSMTEKYDPARAYEVVGVVKDAHYFDLKKDTEPMIYLPVWRAGANSRSVCIRTHRDAGSVVEGLRRLVTAVDPAVPVLHTRTIEQEIDNNILESRLIATLSSFFGALALLLAAIGLYGVISYTVTRRTREIGIRMALGAQRSSVLVMIVRDAALLVAVGALIGIPAALGLSRLVKSFLYGISAQDPVSMALGVVVLAAAAGLASFLPARRGSGVDPMVALRHD